MRSVTRNSVLIFLIFFIFIFASYLKLTSDMRNGDLTKIELVNNLERALSASEELLKENKELRNIINKIINKKDGIFNESSDLKKVDKIEKNLLESNKINFSINNHYSIKHESLLKEAIRNTREMYYFVKASLSKINNKILEEDAVERLISLNVDIKKLYNDGSLWRSGELKKLSNFIQKKIYTLQNPKDCEKTNFMVCNLDKGCGFGCQLHHVAFCFYMALGTNRTLLFEKDGTDWRYSKKGWESVFQPISNCSFEKHAKNKPSITWSGTRSMRSKNAVIKIPIIDYISPKPDFVPLALPKELSDKMIELHSFPTAYFTGQILSYAMRHNDKFEKEFLKYVEEVPFKKTPIVGIHVRRTDKIGTEASFHDVTEYMNHAEIFFREKEIEMENKLDRKVFIATDDSTVITDLRKKYPNYTFYGDEKIASNAGLGKRYEDESLHGTFSSQVSRMAYELMQVESPDDAGYNYASIDDVYYFGGQQTHNLRAIKSHKSLTKEEISFEKDALIGISGNHWNGWSKGTLVGGNHETGLFPSYKVVEDWKIVEMPVFSGFI
ncbi:Alpha-(1,6)-fucosyltransferase [Strongyloides ratti]|uniref:Alpha-(1,6)-fucosyltransferase n=1 Tax=Strongyloides ratti TaxID=34506 RepID=A0A090MZP2_STRRB|nr:Alpha-(1,6)-fucosyltransferase [Strongyloides ratti]CEF69279.1 Alpha-(1,6)-fucosyltransferase [Strongyloides ratti]